MKFARKVLVVLLVLLAVTGCDALKKALTKGVSHKASRINSIQAIGDSREFAIVDIEYVFANTGVSDEKAVFERKDSGKQDTVDIEAAGTLYTDADTLSANSTYTYTLFLLDGSELTEYDEIEVKTLPVLEITLPKDTLTTGAIVVGWKKLSYEGEAYLDYKVALYDGEGLDLTSPDPEMILALTTPIESATVSIGDSDTEGSYTFSTSPPQLAKGYVVTVNTEKGIFDKISNQSTGIKPFVWVSTP